VCEAHGKRFRLGLVSPFDAPQAVAGVTDGHARLRTGEVLFDEAEGGHGHSGGTARSKTQIASLRGRRLVPDAMPNGNEPTRAGAPDPPPAAEIPNEIDGPYRGNRPANRERRVPEELFPVHAIAICKIVPGSAEADPPAATP
jgi:hypothetical protein